MNEVAWNTCKTAEQLRRSKFETSKHLKPGLLGPGRYDWNLTTRRMYVCNWFIGRSCVPGLGRGMAQGSLGPSGRVPGIACSGRFVVRGCFRAARDGGRLDGLAACRSLPPRCCWCGRAPYFASSRRPTLWRCRYKRSRLALLWSPHCSLSWECCGAAR